MVLFFIFRLLNWDQKPNEASAIALGWIGRESNALVHDGRINGFREKDGSTAWKIGGIEQQRVLRDKVPTGCGDRNKYRAQCNRPWV